MPFYIQHKKVKVPYKYLYVNSLPKISSQKIKENLVKIRFQELSKQFASYVHENKNN